MVQDAHYIKDGNTAYFIKPENYTFGSENTIIVKESATGNDAIVINNGKNQQEIPINGTLFGTRMKVGGKGKNDESFKEGLEQLNENMLQLEKLKASRKVIEFIGPFYQGGSNKYFIKSLFFSTINDDNSVGFNMVLSENRTVSVLSIEKNLKVRGGYLQAMIDEQKRLEGVPREITASKTIKEIRNTTALQEELEQEYLDKAFSTVTIGEQYIEVYKYSSIQQEKRINGEISFFDALYNTMQYAKTVRAKAEPDYAARVEYYTNQGTYIAPYTRPYIDLTNVKMTPIENIKIPDVTVKTTHKFAENSGKLYPIPIVMK